MEIIKKWGFLCFFFYSTLSAREGSRSRLASIWRFKAPPRVVAFGWIALRRRILTLDNLRKRRKIVVNACPMCLEDEENVNHHLLRCRCVVKIRNSVISWFGCKWAMPKLFQAFSTFLRRGNFASGLRKERSCGSCRFYRSFGTSGRRETRSASKEQKLMKRSYVTR